MLCVCFSVDRKGSTEHALECLERLIKVLLGPDAIAKDKSSSGPKLVILGVEIELAACGFWLRPESKKAVKWIACMRRVLRERHLSMGEAKKLSGRLTWSCSHQFKRLGRAMIRPIYDQCSRRDGMIDVELLRALTWWVDALQMKIAELRPWVSSVSEICHVFADAQGNPQHLGAVVAVKGKWFWTHASPPPEIMAGFRRREDNQIMGLELLAASLALSTFEHLLQNMRVVLHCDNSRGEVFRFSHRL